MAHDLSRLSRVELLALHAGIADELRRRQVTRTSNNPVGDLAETLFCRAFGWSQATNSMRDTDATDASGVKFQIKGRRLTPHNSSRQLSALRDLPKQGFDFLAGVLFDNEYRVLRAALIPHSVVLTFATRVERTNSWRFLLRDAVWSANTVRDVTLEMRKAEEEWVEDLTDTGQPVV